MYLSASTILNLSFTQRALASIDPVATLSIANANIAPDSHTRSAVLAGGTFPGQTITERRQLQTGCGECLDRYNDAQNNLGRTYFRILRYIGTGCFKGPLHADGPAFVMQCPTAPGDSFLYDFDTPDHADTYWYHSGIGMAVEVHLSSTNLVTPTEAWTTWTMPSISSGTETDLHPLTSPAAPGAANIHVSDVDLNLVLRFESSLTTNVFDMSAQIPITSTEPSHLRIHHQRSIALVP
ncbi:hypothetical protein BJ165DRAFT_1407786 [Panaeolus papilionaceus]|nr:hypothetical protein BJ165DRAFT_1407786 [Panaeolus papilionaceus]